jgi:hypothetical protein
VGAARGGATASLAAAVGAMAERARRGRRHPHGATGQTVVGRHRVRREGGVTHGLLPLVLRGFRATAGSPLLDLATGRSSLQSFRQFAPQLPHLSRLHLSCSGPCIVVLVSFKKMSTVTTRSFGYRILRHTAYVLE